MVNPDIVQLIVFVLKFQTAPAKVAKVVPETASQYTVSVICMLSQVVNVIAPCIIVGVVHVQFFKRVAFIENVVAFALITPALIVFLIKVNPAQSDKVFVCAPEAAIETLCQTQSVNVPPAKQKDIVKGDINKAVVGLFPTPTFVNVIAVATSESIIPSIKELLLTFTEYA